MYHSFFESRLIKPVFAVVNQKLELGFRIIFSDILSFDFCNTTTVNAFFSVLVVSQVGKYLSYLDYLGVLQSAVLQRFKTINKQIL